VVDPPRGISQDPRMMEKWSRASEQEKLRTVKSVGELIQDAIDAGEDPMAGVEYNDEETEGSARRAVGDRAPGALAVASSTVVTRMRQVRDLLRSWGWTVKEASGWETRGVRVLVPAHIGCHHTAATVDADGILINGRSDLQGPLCNFALHKDDVIVLIAAGTANHFGVATVNNDEAYGIEATGPMPVGNTGRDAFPNYDAYIALCVAIRLVHGWGSNTILGHKEVARPDGRKPDPAFEEGKPGDGFPAPYPEMSRFRSACNVTKVLRNPEEPDVGNTENEIKTWVNDCLENKLGLLSGTNMNLAVVGQNNNSQVFSRAVNTNDPNSNVSRLSRLETAMAAQNDLLVAMAANLGDDEADLKAAVSASTVEIKQAIAELAAQPTNPPPGG
jgi:hypothetical protein